jgi:succinoglycan biosynthesis transport protein ExoP
VKTEGGTHQGSTLRDYLQVVRRRKWIIVAAVVLVPLAAVLHARQQPKVYQSSAEVYISHQNLANTLTGTSSSTIYEPPERILQTQADTARAPRLAERVVRAAGVADEMSPGGLLASSYVVPRLESNILDFYVTDYDPQRAVTLATAYARQFTIFRQELDTSSLARARRELRQRINALRANGDTTSSTYQSLVQKEDLIRTMEALQTNNAQLLRPAEYAWQIAPRPFRSGVLGLLLGVALGFGLAFLRDSLDTRVRSADEVGERLGLPLLARLPEPPRRLRKQNRLVMLAEPNGVQAEAFRILRTNLDFVRLDRDARTLMVTSAVEGEGKSTTVANLAIALARVGQRVVLVDLDLRRPFLARFFGLNGRPGLTQVALGHVSLDEALAPIPILGAEERRAAAMTGNGSRQLEGMLEVLPSGPLPPNAGEFMGSEALTGIVGQLRSRADIVLIDSTPLLVVGDAMALAGHVDGVILVTRMNVVRRPMLREVRRVLEASPAENLGFVVAGAGLEEGYGYGGYAYRYTYGKTKEPVL